MANILTVRIGSVCAGGGHIQVHTLVDGITISTNYENLFEILAGRLPDDVYAARRRLLLETPAPNAVFYKSAVESKSVIATLPGVTLSATSPNAVSASVVSTGLVG